jgi:tetratricopeptide (TPR) repeat protein
LIGLLLTLSIAAIVVYSSGATTEQVFQLFFPATSGNLPETLNTQALAIAFTGYMITTNFWLTFMSLLPLPGQDGFIATINLINLFRNRQRSDTVAPAVAPSPAPSRSIMRPSRLRNNAADIHFKIGAEYHEAKQYDDAIARYRQAIDNDQNFGPAYINLALVYLAKNNRQKAIHAFRGAIKYADDQKSQAEAWHQLHLLSGVSPIDEEAAESSMAAMGSTPWTDTKARPNWWGLGIGSGLLLIGTIFLYGYLLTKLIEMLNT